MLETLVREEFLEMLQSVIDEKDAPFFYNIKEVAQMFSRVLAIRGVQFD